MIYHAVETMSDEVTWGTFDDLEEAVERAVLTLCEHITEFDVLAVQGTSGMSLGFPAVLQLPGKRIAVVRKPFEDSHTDPCVRVIGTSVHDKRCVFVDDFVSQGGTRTRVREAIEAAGGKIVAQYESRENAYTTL